MRRFPTLAFLLIATISTLLAAPDLPKITPRYYLNIYTGETKKGRPDDVIPIYTVEQLDSGVRVTYEFKWYRDDTVSTKGKSHIFYLPNFYQTTGDRTPDVPDLPERIDRYKAPCPSEATITIDTYEYKEYNYELAPCAFTRWYPESYSGSIGRMDIKTEGLYPEAPIMRIPTEEDDPELNSKFVSMYVHPIAYNHQTKTVRFTAKLVFTIHYNSQLQTTTNKPIKIASAFREQSNEKDVPGDYLILTTSKCRGAISDFAEWKKAFGYNVHIESSDAWDVKSIKNKVSDYFKKYKKNLQYLLLVGGHDDLPGEARVFKVLEEGKKILQ